MKTTSALAIALAALAADAADLEITSPTTLVSGGTYENAVVSAPLTLDGAQVTATGTSSVDATVTLTNGARFATTVASGRQYSIADIGASGGAGGFDVAAGAYSYTEAALALWIESLRLSAAAATEEDAFDVLALGTGAYADITCFSNLNAKAARYVFRGGLLRNSYKNSRGAPLNAEAGRTILFEGVGGDDIVVVPMHNKPNYFFAGEGTFRTQGDCDFVLCGVGETNPYPAPIRETRDQDPFTGATNSPNRSWMRITSNGTWEWAHTGDFRIQDRGWLRLSRENGLPSGTGTGGVKLDTGSSKVYGARVGFNPCLDLNGYSSTINSLTCDDGGLVTNYATKVAATLTFGAYKSGALKGRICGNIDIAKAGAETTLTVSDAELPQNFTISEGAVRVVAGDTGVSHLGAVTLAAGAALTIDGATATCDSLVNGGGAITYANGGTLVFLKSDSGIRWYPTAAAQFPFDSLHVADGTLVLNGDTCTNEWWRFRFRAANTGSSGLEIGRIALASTTNNMASGQQRLYSAALLNCGLVPCDTPEVLDEQASYTTYAYPAGTATAPQDMPRGTALLKPGVTMRYDQSESLKKNMLDALFDMATSYKSINIATEVKLQGLALDESDSTTWVDVTFRLAESMNRAKAYSLYATKWATTMPRSWLVQSSADGVSWEDMDDRSIASPLASYFTDLGVSYAWYAFPHGYAFTSGHLTGAQGLADGTRVQVDAGATLDCTMVSGGQRISSLAVDAALGCGTFKGVAFAADGAIDVSNWNRAALRNGVTFTLDGSTGAENLKNWAVLEDGRETSMTLRYADGRLYLMAEAFIITVR